jgi:hypothetical protein
VWHKKQNICVLKFSFCEMFCCWFYMFLFGNFQESRELKFIYTPMFSPEMTFKKIIIMIIKKKQNLFRYICM